MAKYWKNKEKLTPIELLAVDHYANTGCCSSELVDKFKLKRHQINKVLQFGLEQMKQMARERKLFDGIEQAGIENELVTINDYINGKEQNSTS